MGCCHSTNNGDEPQPSPPTASKPAAVAIKPPPRLARSPRNVSNQQPPWTRAHLERQREIFFETQTSGDAQVWATLRTVSEHVRRGEMKEAQAIFDAAGLTCPDGNYAKGKRRVDPATRTAIPNGGVYDVRGRRYAIPLWCCRDPEDIVEEHEQQREGQEKDDAPVDMSMDSSGDEDMMVSEAPARQYSREDKGKERQGDIGEPLRVRARLTSTAEDLYIRLGSKQPVKVLVDDLRNQLAVSADGLRIMFKGKELSGNRTLEEQGWTTGDTLSVFVRPQDVSA